MQFLSVRTITRPACVAGNLRLLVSAVISAMLCVIFLSSAISSEAGTTADMALGTCPAQLINNNGFELAGENPDAALLDWTTTQWLSTSQFARDSGNAHSGASSSRITAATINDAWFSQEITVEPNTYYALTGWIKTENVAGGAGANLSLIGTWTHTQGLFGTNNWTHVSLSFNSGSSTHVIIGARLGYWGSMSTGTAWFDDLRVTPIKPDGTHPSWKILVLIYDRTDAVVTDTSGVTHHMVATMTPAEVERAAVEATEFVETDIPALTSGNMIPELTIRYPDHALTQLDAFGQAWWPSPANTAAERDPAFDSVIVIWDPRVVDEYTGIRYWIGGGAGLTPPMGTGQPYATIIIEATGYGHRNVFKHEWGHSILAFFDAVGTAPKPTVTNHVEINQYVHWPTGDNYVWLDETDANLIPNSIYNNESGFTHDYYSGTTATPDEPTRRLGITPEAWMLGGPVTRPAVRPAPSISCNTNVTLISDPVACSAFVSLIAPAASDACDSDLTPVATRSDGFPLDGPYSIGETVVTWSVTNTEGLTSTCQQSVTVVDDTPPMIVGAEVSPATLWPPKHDMVDVTVNYEAADNCAILATSLSVSSDDSSAGGSDWEVMDAHHVRLRAAKSGRWGRLYTITITAKDIHGNTSTAEVTVRVSNGKGSAGFPRLE